MKRLIGIILLSLMYGGKTIGQSSDFITSHFLKQLALFPQEKIFVHTDRTSYMSGDTIWLRAYVVDAATHIPTSVSRYVYVELADEADTVVNRIKLKVDDDIYRGQIPLDPHIRQGYYTLRAYTGFMKNLKEDYIFKSTISISNAYTESADEVSKKEMSESKSKKHKNESESESPDFDVTFFPEGGYLPAGVEWRTAFKAIGSDGWNRTITGEIIDKATGDTITYLPNQYLGMGYVTFTPEEGKQYVARCTDSKDQTHEFELPKVTKGAQVLAANWRKDLLTVSLSQSIEKPLRLVMQNRGIVFYSGMWNPEQKILGFEAKMIPAGVIQILLLDENNQPLSERLVFSMNLEGLKLGLTTDKATYEPHQKVKAEVNMTDDVNSPLEGDVSVSVTDDATVNTDNASSILSYMLLTSDLKGTIEFPEAYFDPDKKHMDRKLDILMMTQGWRRYDISKIIKGEYERPTIMPEKCQEITGTVVGNLTLKPKANCQLSLLSIDHFFVDEAVSDSLGRFCFTRFEMPDSTSFVLKALNRKGQNTVLLNIDKEKFYSFQQSKSIADLYKRKELEQEYKFDTLTPGIRLVNLAEVVIKAKAPEKKGKSMYHSMMGSVFSAEDFMRPLPNTLQNLLERLPGVFITGGAVTMRGQKPMFMLDDVEFEFDAIKDMPAEDIDEIELLKDASAAIFGSKGGGGAILITTKTGVIHKGVAKPNVAWTRPLGYQIPVEFYSPKYEPDKEIAVRIPDKRKTLYWNPCIRIPKTGKAEFEFYTADNKTTYTMIIQGMTTDGKVIYKKENIAVPLKSKIVL